MLCVDGIPIISVVEWKVFLKKGSGIFSVIYFLNSTKVCEKLSGEAQFLF